MVPIHPSLWGEMKEKFDPYYLEGRYLIQPEIGGRGTVFNRGKVDYIGGASIVQS